MNQLKYHYIYKTTNLLNEKFYIGRHSTNKLEDGYLGSGKVLDQSFKKRGRKNFKCEVLEYCDTFEILCKRETFWIRELDAIKKGYNLTEESVGGNLNCDSYKNRFIEDIKCPHCEKVSKNKPMMYNIHFDNCVKNPNLDIEKFEERKLKRSIKLKESSKNRPYKVCPWCNYKSNNEGVLQSKHFDNCKENPNYVDKRLDIICPHCGKVGKVKYMMERYHFDNCKLSPLFNEEKARKRKNSENVINLIKERNATKEWKENVTLSWKNREKIICPHCNLESNHKGNMNRYHFDNCKLNPNNIV